MTAQRAKIFALIDAERARHRDLWDESHGWGEGDCSSPHVPPPVKAAVLAEECGEVARAVLDRDHSGLARELVQVAAVAVAWLEAEVPDGTDLPTGDAGGLDPKRDHDEGFVAMSNGEIAEALVGVTDEEVSAWAAANNVKAADEQPLPIEQLRSLYAVLKGRT